jgi:hypothetical protein
MNVSRGGRTFPGVSGPAADAVTVLGLAGSPVLIDAAAKHIDAVKSACTDRRERWRNN